MSNTEDPRSLESTGDTGYVSGGGREHVGVVGLDFRIALEDTPLRATTQPVGTTYQI